VVTSIRAVHTIYIVYKKYTDVRCLAPDYQIAFSAETLIILNTPLQLDNLPVRLMKTENRESQ